MRICQANARHKTDRGRFQLAIWYVFKKSLVKKLVIVVECAIRWMLICFVFFQETQEESKLQRRELGSLKNLIEEIVRSGYGDGGVAFRPGK